MKYLLLIILSGIIFCTFVAGNPLQTPATTPKNDDEKWWTEVKVLGEKAAQIKKTRYDALTKLHQKISDHAQQVLLISPGRTYGEIQAQLLNQAIPEFTAIHDHYDPQISDALQKYLTKLQELNQEELPLEEAGKKLKPTMLYMEKARYAEPARQARVQGNVLLKVIFLRNGTIGKIEVVRGLPNGLNEEAIKAAKELIFLPARKDGKIVSVRLSIEYSFNLI